MALFASKRPPAEPPLLEKEGHYIAQLNAQAYSWLGPGYRYYHRIRSADRHALHLFGERNLEELMEATRSALSLVTKTLNGGLALAFNNAVESVKNAEAAPEGWPERMEVPDRNNPPAVSNDQDALIIAWAPVKFLNLAKMVRDKGKGLDHYAEGVIKKLYFKVVGYYCDPAHWNRERLGYPLHGLPADAPLGDVQSKLSALKGDLEVFASTYQLFRFGRSPRTGADAGSRNALEDILAVPDEELVADLYFQNFIVHGLEHFLFRYYLTLLSCTDNPRAFRVLTQLFEPALNKAVEVRLMFQASFMMEKEKLRLRNEYQAFARRIEALPVVETVEEKGRPMRRIHYTTKLLDLVAFSYTSRMGGRQRQTWAAYLKANRMERPTAEREFPLFMELLNSLVRFAQYEFDGKLKVVDALRGYAGEQEKAGKRQVTHRRKQLDEAKRKKLASARKFRRLEQFDMVRTVEEEAQTLEHEGLQQIEALEAGVARRRQAVMDKAQQLEESTRREGLKAAARGAAVVYGIADELDPESRLDREFIGYLLQHIQHSQEATHADLYRHLFEVVPHLSPTQKIMFRKAVESRVALDEGDLEVSEEELRTYREQIDARKTELTQEAPGIFDKKLMHGPVKASLEQMLQLGLTNPSLRLVLQLPLHTTGKGTARLPGAAAQKLVQLNTLINPFPTVDLVLPNVEGEAPPAKRINFNRLARALTETS